MENDLLVTFVDDLVVQAGFKHLSPEKETEYKLSLIDLVTRKLGLMAIKQLREKDLKKYFKLIEKSPSPEELYKFFNKRIKDFDSKTVQVLKEFREQFLQDLSDAESFSKK